MHGIDHDQGGSRVGVDEVAAVALSERVQNAGLVEEAQRRQVLHSVKRRRVSLKHNDEIHLQNVNLQHLLMIIII